MSTYASLIDPAEFGLIADYLRSPRTPILHLLHVKSMDLLAPLAEGLANQGQLDTPPWLFPEVVQRGLREGTLLISTRHPLNGSDSKHSIEAAAIPRRALCHVIYAPPFYLVHTPGLLEGTLIRPKTETSLRRGLHQKRAPRIKP